MPKSYNIQALRGLPITDEEHAADIGIDVPNDILYTPQYNDYLLDRIYESNLTDLQKTMNPTTGHNYTEQEAMDEAKMLRRKAHENIMALMK